MQICHYYNRNKVYMALNRCFFLSSVLFILYTTYIISIIIRTHSHHAEPDIESSISSQMLSAAYINSAIYTDPTELLCIVIIILFRPLELPMPLFLFMFEHQKRPSLCVQLLRVQIPRHVYWRIPSF